MASTLLFLIVDVILAVVGFVSTYYAYRVSQLFGGDIMHRIFIIMAVALMLIGLASVADAVTLAVGIEGGFPYVRIADILVILLITAGMISLLRWGEQTTELRTGTRPS